MQTLREIRADWLARLLSTEPVDRAQAESALRELYATSDLPGPDHFFWFDSPFAALWAMALLTAAHDSLWQRIVEAMGRNKREREYMEHPHAMMCQTAAQPDWKSLIAAAGKPMAVFLMRQNVLSGQPVKMIQNAVSTGRMQFYPDVAVATPSSKESDDLSRAEYSMRSVLNGPNGRRPKQH